MIGRTSELGFTVSNIAIENCSADVNITVAGDEDPAWIGGFIGSGDGEYIYQSSSSGSINTIDSHIVGGFIGYVEFDRIEQCYSTTDVTGNFGITGFIGEIEYGIDSVSNVYSTGDITFINNSKKNYKYFISEGVNENTTQHKRYCNADITNNNESRCTELTTSSMMKKESYSTFNFKNVWKTDENKSTPKLRWQKD